MKKILLLLLITSMLISCKDKEKDRLYDELIAGYQRGNSSLKDINRKIYWSIKEKLRKPETIDVALIWEPKITLIRNKSDTLLNYLDSCIVLLKQDSFAPNLEKEYNKLFMDLLYKRLLNLKKTCLAIDPEIKSNFEKNILITTIHDTIEVPLDVFNATVFHNKKEAIAFLSGVENNILNLEYYLIDFCDKKTIIIDEGWFSFSAIAVQNTEHLKAGEKLRIIAGEGCFSKKRNNRVFINNKQIKLNAEGVAEFEMTAPKVLGKYHIPVKIEFTRPDSTKDFLDKDIVFTVDE